MRSTDLIEKSCLTCMGLFKTQFRNLARGRGKFCSKKCSNTNVVNRAANREKQINTGAQLSYRKFYGRHEHRVIMETHIERKLLSNEIVHHIDGDIRNNNINNLQLMTWGEHSIEHHRKFIGCLISSCKSKHKSRGLCGAHYEKMKYYSNKFFNNLDIKVQYA